MTGSIRQIILLSSVLLFAAAYSAFAGGCVDSVDKQLVFRNGAVLSTLPRLANFLAIIGERDLHNSKGVRLSDFRAIIQQDRANMHKSGIADNFDTIKEKRDTYFTTPDRRRLLSTARYYDYCSNSSDTVTWTRKAIVSGQVPGGIWVILFRHPDGELAIFMTLVG